MALKQNVVVRWFRHLFTGVLAVRRAFPPASLAAIGQLATAQPFDIAIANGTLGDSGAHRVDSLRRLIASLATHSDPFEKRSTDSE